MNEYKEPCISSCLKHKYHCVKCGTAITYSPANHASRPYDIPNPCMYCDRLLSEIKVTPLKIENGYADGGKVEVAPPTNDWEVEFDKQMYPWVAPFDKAMRFPKLMWEIKNFIRTLLKSKALEIEEEIKMTRLCLSPEAEKVMDIAEKIIKSKLL